MSTEEILALARHLTQRGDLDRAEKVWRALLRGSPSEEVRTEAAFQVGQLLVRRGRYREAASFYIDILNRRPDLPRVRLELARAYFLDKNYPDATFQFELLKGGKLPPEVIANVDAFLDRIRRQKNWTFNFGMSPVSDSNINQASGGQECMDISAYGLGSGVWCNPLEKESGIGLNLNVNLDWFKRLSQDWGLRTSVGLYALEYKGGEFDDYMLHAALGPRYLWANGEASLQPTFRKRWYAGKAYREEYGLRLDGRQILGRVILDSGASFDKISYDNAYVDSLLRGHAWSTRLRARYILNDRTFVQAGADFLREDAKEAAYANDNWTGSLGAYRALPQGFSLFVEASFTRSRYQAQQLYADQDNRIAEAVRRDGTLGLYVSLSSNRFERYNLTPILRYSHTHRRSNIWSHEYRRNRLDFLLDIRV
ncbi:MAG: surface lipoprotein assembly modifier [Azoarcus sp.]|nr:surface lipoprotein assembly modifier [Azoarcus sp.]